MDYYEIGQRIRKCRRDRNLTQEELAEKVDISTTHMSHIETGNTKLSLPVFVGIARALEVRTDDLLEDSCDIYTSGNALDEISEILKGCSSSEAKIIADVAKSVKLSMDKHL